MAPSDYIEARKHLLDPIRNGDKSVSSAFPIQRFVVDGRAYLPSLDAVDGDDDSIRQVVCSLFELSVEQLPKLQVRNVAGGITNKLYHVSGLAPLADDDDDDDDDDDVPPEVLVRIFGGHGMIDRDVETSTYAALAAQGLALPYYGRFGNGRLEAWCPNSVHLQVRELSDPELSRGIARSLGRLHSQFVIPEELYEYHNPASPPTLWTQLESWLQQAQNASFALESDTRRAAVLPLSGLTDELTWLKKDVCNPTAKVGFCHNDLLAANFLKTGHGTIQLIDFEYGGINYLAYDIANHFNEFAGGTDQKAGTPDYSLFPSPAQQEAFARDYLIASGVIAEDDNGNDHAVHALLLEIKGFVLANHLVWGLWAVNQAASEGCENFDYLQYAKCRIERFFLEKGEWQSQQ